MKHGLLFAAAALLAAHTTYAQAPDTVETDPIRCWWRTSSGAVRIGEPFTLTLTCAVLDTEAIRVVPDESRLAHAVIQMAPFEVVTGAHPPDIFSGQRRFLQYEYTLRSMSADMIGQDVPLPNLSINYRVNSRMPGNATIEGRDLTYLLPPLQVRVLSTVPADATDIRDTPSVSFGRIEALTYRAGAFDIAAVALVAIGGILAVMAVLGLVRRPARTAAASEHLLGERAILGAARGELAAVQRESEAGGWSDALIDRALAATRLVAAVAAGRRINQQPAGNQADSQEGRVIVSRALPRRRVFAVSSAATPADLANDAAQVAAGANGDRRQMLEQLASALGVLSAAQYTRAKTRDQSALASATAAAADAASRLKTERMWPREEWRRFTTRGPELEHT